VSRQERDAGHKLSIRYSERVVSITCPFEERSDLLDSDEFLNAKLREIAMREVVSAMDRIAVSGN